MYGTCMFFISGMYGARCLSQMHFTNSYGMWNIPSMFYPRSSFFNLNMLILFLANKYTVLLLYIYQAICWY
jgi:hypothetical protein